MNKLNANVQLPPEVLALCKKLSDGVDHALAATYWLGFRDGALCAALTLVVLFVLITWRKR
jgi:hypothetical protein